MRKLFTKIFRWEFWPFWLFYIPIYFYWFFLSLKARSLFFFGAANPLMELGGLKNYSKSNVLQHIPKEYLPKTIYIQKHEKSEKIADLLEQNAFYFPFVAKPDKGERGKMVRLIRHQADLEKYLATIQDDFIIQEFSDLPLEFGVMYHHFPNEKTGHISSMVQKGFLTVEGNGTDTVQTLMQKHERAFLYIENLVDIYGKDILEKTPIAGEKLLLEPIGNHARGTIFMNANHLINKDLHDVFNKISLQIDGFFFGRFDLKVSSVADLYEGKNIKIMELNGANSEPAHIYDPAMPIWKAYRHLFWHWSILFQISTENHRKGIPYPAFWESWKRMWN